MASPTFFGAGALAAVNSGNVSPALPASTVADDVALLVVRTNVSNTFPTITGWDPLIAGVSNVNMSWQIYWRRLTGSGDTPAPFSIAGGTSLSNSNGLYARIYVFRGVSTDADPFSAGAGLQGAKGPTLSTTPSTDPFGYPDNDVFQFIPIILDDDNDWASGMPPAGYSELGTHTTSIIGGDGAIHAIGIARAISGTAPGVTVGTQDASDYWVTGNIFLKSATPTPSLVVSDCAHGHQSESLLFPPDLQYRWVVVGYNGKMYWSDNLANAWNEVTTHGFGIASIDEIAYLQKRGVYLARSSVGAGGSVGVRRSGDLASWTAPTIGFGSTPNYNGLAKSETLDQFLVVGNDTGGPKISLSTDGGSTWALSTQSAVDYTFSACYYSELVDLWLVGGSNLSSESSDLHYSASGASSSWTTVTDLYTTSNAIGFCDAPSLGLVITWSTSGKTWTSTNGTSWTERANVHGSDLRDIAWSPVLSMFVAVGLGGKVAYSTNGTSWTASTSGACDFITVEWSNSMGLFLANGYHASGSITGKKSSNGTTWSDWSTYPTMEAVHNILWTADTTLEPDDVRHEHRTISEWTPERFLLSHWEGGEPWQISESSDGINWSDLTVSGLPNGLSPGYFTMPMAYSPTLKLWVAGNSGGGNLYSSPDGAAWTSRSTLLAVSTNEYRDIIWCPAPANMFVATGTQGYVATSPDGITWTRRNTGFETVQGINGLAYSPELNRHVYAPIGSYMGYSNDNYLTTSYNLLPGSRDNSCVEWADGIFVVGCEDGYIRYSTDGIGWTDVSIMGTTSVSVTDLAYSPELGIWLAICGLRIATSPDGINWTRQTDSPIGNYHVEWSSEIGKFVFGTASATQVGYSTNGTSYTLANHNQVGTWPRQVAVQTKSAVSDVSLVVSGRVNSVTNGPRTSAYNLAGRYWLFHELYTPSGLLQNSYWRLARTDEEETGFEFLSSKTLVSGNTINAFQHDGVVIGDDRVIIVTNRRSDPDTNGNLQARCFAHAAGASTVTTGSQTTIITDRTTDGTAMQTLPRVSRLTDSKTVLGTLGRNAALTDWCYRLAVAQHGASGTTITPGTSVDIASPAGVATGIEIVGMTDTEFVLVGWNATDVYAQRVTVASGTGTAITAGTWSAALNPAILASSDVRAEKIDDDRILISYYDSATGGMSGGALYAQVLDITSGSLVAGSPTVIDDGWTSEGASGDLHSLHVQPSDHAVIGASVNANGSGPSYWSVSQAGTTGTALSIAKPSVFTETAFGYFAMVAVDGDDGTITVTPDQAGWTEITDARVVNTGNIGIRVFRRNKTDSDPANFTFTLSSNPNAGARGVIVAVFGAAFDFVDDNPLSIVTATGSSNSAGIGAITTNRAADPMLIAVSAVGSSVTHTAPSGYTERADGATGTMALSVATIAAANNPAASFGLSGSAPWATVHISAPNGIGGPWYYIAEISGTTITPVRSRVKPSTENGGPLDGEAFASQLKPSDTVPETYFGMLSGSTWGWVDLAEQGDPTLLTSDARHGHTSDSAVLTQTHTLSGISDARHADSSDNVVLSITSTLIVADSFHGDTSDSVTLTQTHVLVGLSDARHGDTSDNVALTQGHTLSGVADAFHGNVVDGAVLSQVHAISGTSDAVHSHSADPVILGLNLATQTVTGTFDASEVSEGADVEIRVLATAADGTTVQIESIGWTATWLQGEDITLELSDAGHSHSSDDVALVQQHNLVAADSSHANSADSVTLTQGHVLSGVSDSYHANSSDTVALTQIHVLTISDASHAHTSDNVALTQAHTLTGASDAHHSNSSDSVALTQTHSLAGVSDSSHGHTSDSVAFTQVHSLAGAQDAIHAHSADSVLLAQQHSISLADSHHNHTADTVALTQTHAIAVIDAQHGHTSDNATLTQDQILAGLSDAYHAHSTDPVALIQQHTLAGLNDARHNHSVDNATLTQSHVLAAVDSSHAHSVDNVALIVNLAVVDSHHSHSSDSVSVTQVHNLVAVDPYHSHSVDSAGTLTQQHNVAVTDASHGHTSDNAVLTQQQILVINDAFHGHTADNVALVQQHTLAGASDAAHSHSADTTALTQTHVLDLTDSRHDHTAETPSLIVDLAVADSHHDHSSDNVAITQNHAIVVSDTSHEHTADSASLTQTHVLAASDVEHNHRSENVTLTGEGTLGIQNAFHFHTADNVDLVQQHTISVSDVVHEHSVDGVAITQSHLIAPADTAHGHSVETVALAVTYHLAADDSRHEHTVESVAFTQTHVLSASDVDHTHTVDNVGPLAVTHHLVGQDAFHAHSADTVTLAQQHTLTASDVAHIHSAENVTLTAEGSLSVNDAYHGHSVENAVLTQSHTLVAQDSHHVSSSDPVALTQVHAIGVSDTAHTHTVDAVVLAVIYSLVAADARHAHNVDSVAITQIHALSANDVHHGHVARAITLTQQHTLEAADSEHDHAAETVTLTASDTLSVSDAAHGHSVESLSLSVISLLIVTDAVHRHTTGSPTLDQLHVLVVAEAIIEHAVDEVNLQAVHVLEVADVTVTHTVEEVLLPGDYPAGLLRIAISTDVQERIMVLSVQERTLNPKVVSDRPMNSAVQDALLAKE